MYLLKEFVGLVGMMFGLVHLSYVLQNIHTYSVEGNVYFSVLHLLYFNRLKFWDCLLQF